jgi:hypothetical protein
LRSNSRATSEAWLAASFGIGTRGRTGGQARMIACPRRR